MPIDPQMLSMIQGGAEPVQAPPVPMPQAPKRNPLELMAPLFALGAALSGNPQGGQRFLSSAQQAQDRIRQQTQEDEAFALRRQQIELQAARDAEVMRQREAERQQRAQALLLKTMQDVAEAVPTFKKKADYDQYIDFAEQTLAVSGVRIPPNSLRAKFPYRAPNASQLMTEALDKLFKNPVNKAAMESGAILQGALSIDTDGDGIPDKPIPVSQAIKESGYPVVLGQNGEPIIAPNVKPENLSEFERALQIATEKFTAEKGRAPQTAKDKEAVYQDAQRMAQKPPDPMLAEIRALTAANLRRGNGGADLTPAQFNMAGKLADDFRMESKDYQVVENSYARVKESAADPSPAGDLALIFNYMKILDPGSVVREAEFANAAKAGSLPQQIQASAMRIVNGQRLTPEQRTDFVRRAERLYGAALNQHQRRIQHYTRRAQGMKIPPDYVVAEPDPGLAPPRSFTVTAPNGKTYTFGSQEQLDAFKKSAGIK